MRLFLWFSNTVTLTIFYEYHIVFYVVLRNLAIFYSTSIGTSSLLVKGLILLLQKTENPENHKWPTFINNTARYTAKQLTFSSPNFFLNIVKVFLIEIAWSKRFSVETHTTLHEVMRFFNFLGSKITMNTIFSLVIMHHVHAARSGINLKQRFKTTNFLLQFVNFSIVSLTRALRARSLSIHRVVGESGLC